MRKIFILLVSLFFLSCATQKKVEEILPQGPVIKLKLSTSGLEREGLWRENLCVADIDNDGNLDIVAPPPRGEDRPVIFLGDGKGNWQEWKEVEFPNLPFAYGGVDVADLDKNGLPDIALACHSGRIYVLLQKEKGKFEDLSNGFPTPDKFSSRAIKFADFNGDGVEEIVTINETALYLGSNKPNPIRQKVFKLEGNYWEEIPILPSEKFHPCFGDSVLIGDFNLDGIKDFAIPCNVYLWKEILFINEDGNKFIAQPINELPSFSYFFHLTSGDFNNDNRIDLAFSSVTFDKSETARKEPEKAMLSRILIALNLEKRWEVVEVSRHNAGKDLLQFRAISANDLNGDGFDDIASIFDDSEIYIYSNVEGKSFQKAKVDGFIKRGKSYWMDIKDVNKDGKNDIIIAYGAEKGGGKIDVYLNETP